MTLKIKIDDLVRSALEEDLGAEGVDLTSQLALEVGCLAAGRFVFREQGVFCGQDWLQGVFRQLDADIAVEMAVADGEWLEAGRAAVPRGGAVHLPDASGGDGNRGEALE